MYPHKQFFIGFSYSSTVLAKITARNQRKKIINIYYERRSKPEPSRGCLSCICSHVPGFRDRKEAQNLSNRSQKQQHSNRRKNSVESQHSVGSGQGPPHGTRVVLGRETSPSPATCQPGITESVKPRLPAEIMDKFSGQTREVSPGVLMT